MLDKLVRNFPAVVIAAPALLALALMPAAADATNFVVALAAKPQDGAKDGIAELVKGLYRKLGPGDVLVVEDATNLREVARVAVPDNPALATNRNFKARLINPEFAKVWDFVDAGAAASGVPGDVGIPHFLIELRAIMDGLHSRAAEVVIVGSALFSDPREAGSFSMQGGAVGYVPTDEHLLLSQDRSPFGVAGRATALAGATVHICATNPTADWTTDDFRQHVGRFWALASTLQGARFGGFGPLDSRCIGDFLDGEASSETFTLDRRDHKATMIKFERPSTAREPEHDSPASAPATPEAMFQRPPCTTAPRTMTGPMRIGIKWEVQADLDLYARSRPGADWLYFNHRLPADKNGYFDHDFTAPPPGTDAYEFIQFDNIDLREVGSSRVDLQACKLEYSIVSPK